jgi:hypothetical protein
MNEQEVWRQTHAELQQSMKKEIETMREILANLHQEELSLMSKDKIAWAHVIEERAKLLSQLSDLRDSRLQTTLKLQSLAFPQGSPGDVPLEQLLPAEDASSCETLSLRDQMVALLDRLNLQSNRNELLSTISERHEQAPVLQQEQPKKKKSKISVATLPPKE